MKRLLAAVLLSVLGFVSVYAAKKNETEKKTENLLDVQYVPLKLGERWVMIPGTPKAGWMNAVPNGGIPFNLNGRFDLDTLKRGKVKDECVIYHEFEVAEAGEYLLGFSADWWWELYLNGKLCLSTMQKGNGKGAYKAEDHPMFLKLKKGKNLLAVRVRRGLSSWIVACQGVTTPPTTAQVVFGPWLCSPDTGSIGIRFLTFKDIGGGIEYREKGASAWQTRWHARYGQILRTDNHYVQLTGLKSGAEYEYRIIMRSPENPLKLVRDKHVYNFTVPDAAGDHVSFLFTADLQYSLETQRKYTKAMFKAADYKTADFFVLGGDMVEYQDIRSQLLSGMIQNVINHGATEKPIVFVRGNHELRGAEACLFNDFFALPNGRTYGIFRFGSTAFLVLDCWEDKPAISNVESAQFNLDREFLREEKEYLEEVLKTPAWTNAKRRIVLAHGAAYSNYDGCRWQPFRIQRMTDAWFHGKNPKYRLNLWLCGHSHAHLRSIPGTDILVSKVKPHSPFRTGKDDIYPVLTTGGPNGRKNVQASTYRVDVFPDRIAVKAFDQSGKLIDDVVYHDNGIVKEQIDVPHFHVPATKLGDAYYKQNDLQ